MAYYETCTFCNGYAPKRTQQELLQELALAESFPPSQEKENWIACIKHDLDQYEEDHEKGR
jgi:hypothetical protein